MYSPACLLFYRYTDVSSHFALQNPASHVCWRFILMCHLALDFVHLITVNHPTTMYLIMFGLNTWYSIRTITPLEKFTWSLVELIKLQLRSNKREYQRPFVVVHSLSFGGRVCFFSSRGFKTNVVSSIRH